VVEGGRVVIGIPQVVLVSIHTDKEQRTGISAADAGIIGGFGHFRKGISNETHPGGQPCRMLLGQSSPKSSEVTSSPAVSVSIKKRCTAIPRLSPNQGDILTFAGSLRAAAEPVYLEKGSL
jgi:hypothetical protein